MADTLHNVSAIFVLSQHNSVMQSSVYRSDKTISFGGKSVHYLFMKLQNILPTLLRLQLLWGAAIVFGLIYWLQRFILFDIEQTRLFVYESTVISNIISNVGGLSELVALWLQQFFRFNFAAPAILTVISVLITINIQAIFKSLTNRALNVFEILCSWIPSMLLVTYNCFIYSTTGHIALLFATTGLLIYAKSIINCKNNIVASALTLLLVLTVGFVASTCVWPMVISMLIIGYHKNNRLNIIAVAVSAILMIILARLFCLALNSSELFSPNIFTIRSNKPSPMIWIWASWILFVALTIIKQHQAEAAKYIGSIGLALSIILPIATNDQAAIELLWLQRQMDTNNYNDAYEYTRKHINNAYMSNIYSKLMSMTGQMQTMVGKTIVNEVQLVMPEQDDAYIRRMLMTNYYYLGYVNGAQRMAFELNEQTIGMMRPDALIVLARTNIIQGNYAVAQKYLNHLKNSLFYKKIAEHYSKFLWNEKAIASSPELSARRLALNFPTTPDRLIEPKYLIKQIALVSPSLPAKIYYDVYEALGAYNVEE